VGIEAAAAAEEQKISNKSGPKPNNNTPSWKNKSLK
jgi:hypothetical protein